MKYNNRGIGSRRLVVNRNSLKSRNKVGHQLNYLVLKILYSSINQLDNSTDHISSCN